MGPEGPAGQTGEKGQTGTQVWQYIWVFLEPFSLAKNSLFCVLSCKQ